MTRRLRGGAGHRGGDAMVMVLPFFMGLLAGLFAIGGWRRTALGLCLATVVVQVWWLCYHSTSTLGLSL